jgi:hypothetical protein
MRYDSDLGWGHCHGCWTSLHFCCCRADQKMWGSTIHREFPSLVSFFPEAGDCNIGDGRDGTACRDTCHGARQWCSPNRQHHRRALDTTRTCTTTNSHPECDSAASASKLKSPVRIRIAFASESEKGHLSLLRTRVALATTRACTTAESHLDCDSAALASKSPCAHQNRTTVIQKNNINGKWVLAA